MVLQGAAHLVQRTIRLSLVARLQRLEPKRERIAHAPGTDLLAAVHVEEPHVLEPLPGGAPGNAEHLADRRLLGDDHGKIPVDRLCRRNRRDTDDLGAESQQAAKIDRRVDRTPG